MRVLFLCTGNSCRSQMAEGWARHLRGDAVEPHSAGIRKHGLNPLAVRAMAEAGVDISGHRSKTVEELGGMRFDLVVTVCGHANEHCPVFLGAPRVLHAGFDDPPRLAEDAASDEEAMAHYRRVRDEIRDFVAGMDAGGDHPAPEGSRKPAVLFLCTHNAARSQMAEGVLRHLAGDRFRALSAGIEPKGVHPLAIEVMAEIGIDISAQESKAISAVLGREAIAHAIFVCAKAESQCPRIYPFALRAYSWPFEDPVAADGPEELRRQRFRQVRDQISARIQAWLDADAKGAISSL